MFSHLEKNGYLSGNFLISFDGFYVHWDFFISLLWNVPILRTAFIQIRWILAHKNFRFPRQLSMANNFNGSCSSSHDTPHRGKIARDRIPNRKSRHVFQPDRHQAISIAIIEPHTVNNDPVEVFCPWNETFHVLRVKGGHSYSLRLSFTDVTFYKSKVNKYSGNLLIFKYQNYF